MADAFQDRLDDSLSDAQGLGGRLARRRPQGSPVRRLRRLQERDRPGRRRPPDHAARTSGRSTWPTPSRRASTPSSRSRWPPTAPASARSSQACKDAKAKNLSLVTGFCWRYDGPRRETMKRVFDGKIGDIVAIETTYNSQGVWDPRKTREQCSLGHGVPDAQLVLLQLALAATTSSSRPCTASTRWPGPWATSRRSSCWGVGGRQSRTDPKYGNI